MFGEREREGGKCGKGRGTMNDYKEERKRKKTDMKERRKEGRERERERITVDDTSECALQFTHVLHLSEEKGKERSKKEEEGRTEQREEDERKSGKKDEWQAGITIERRERRVRTKMAGRQEGKRAGMKGGRTGLKKGGEGEGPRNGACCRENRRRSPWSKSCFKQAREEGRKAKARRKLGSTRPIHVCVIQLIS